MLCSVAFTWLGSRFRSLLPDFPFILQSRIVFCHVPECRLRTASVGNFQLCQRCCNIHSLYKIVLLLPTRLSRHICLICNLHCLHKIVLLHQSLVVAFDCQCNNILSIHALVLLHLGLCDEKYVPDPVTTSNHCRNNHGHGIIFGSLPSSHYPKCFLRTGFFILRICLNQLAE